VLIRAVLGKPQHEPLSHPNLHDHIPHRLFAEVAAVEINDQGDPLYLEAHVDSWLACHYGTTPQAPVAACPGTNAATTEKGRPHEECYVTVAEAHRRYLSGKMSSRWWYRMVQSGRIAHQRIGGAILLRTDDIERFIAESRQAVTTNSPAESDGSSLMTAGASVNRKSRRRTDQEIRGFRFFLGDAAEELRHESAALRLALPVIQCLHQRRKPALVATLLLFPAFFASDDDGPTRPGNPHCFRTSAAERGCLDMRMRPLSPSILASSLPCIDVAEGTAAT